MLIGLCALALGFYLLFNPEGPRRYLGSSDAGFDVVNLQKLYLGQTLAIIGAVFLAVGIRPLK